MAAAADVPDPLSSRALRHQLSSLDASVGQLQRLWQEAAATTLAAIKRELQEETENSSLRRHALPGDADSEASGTYTGRPTTVAQLQSIGNTRAYILYPHMGRTSVYPLTLTTWLFWIYRSVTQLYLLNHCNFLFQDFRVHVVFRRWWDQRVEFPV